MQLTITRRIYLILCFMSICAGGANAAEEFSGRVTGVETGDLLIVEHSRQSIRVHLNGLACPKLEQPYGGQALKETLNAAQGETVTVRIAKRLGAEEVSGTVMLAGKRELNAFLLEKGLAWWDQPNAPENKPYQALQEKARLGRRGLWRDPAPVAPWTDRPEAAAEKHSLGRAFWLMAVLAGLLLLVNLMLLARRPKRAPVAQSAGLTKPAPETPRQEVAEATAAQHDAIEAGKRAIQALLQSLAECVGDLLEQNATYNHRMEGHQVTIRKAMMRAGLEEIGRLLVTEIDGIKQSSEAYRSQLEQANDKLREQQEAMEKVQLESTLDFLTRVPNRRAFDARLAEEFARAARYGSPFSMVMLDIDHFKQVNDDFGHPVGDKVLQLVAHILKEQVRQTDFLGRYGGEEFAVLLPETRAAQARTAAEKLRLAVMESALMHEKARISVTISGGVSEARLEQDRPEDVLARADAALYQAKEKGRNRICAGE